MKRLCILVSTLIMVLGLSVSAQGALVDMKDGTIYDTATQLSWLKDANYAMTSGYDADGRMTWADANAWAASLNNGGGFAGLTGWRLPTADESCNGGTGGSNCTNGEMGHLYYTELGNVAGGPLTNTGPFINVQTYSYWSCTVYAPNPSQAWVLDFTNGTQGADGMTNARNAWAVRPGARLQSTGNATSVPTMTEWGMIIFIVLAGIGSVYYLRRQRRA